MLGSGAADQHVAAVAVPGQQRQQVAGGEQVRQQVFVQAPAQELLRLVDQPPALDVAADRGRSEERRVGKEGVSTCRSGWSPYPYKKKNTKHNTITKLKK